MPSSSAIRRFSARSRSCRDRVGQPLGLLVHHSNRARSAAALGLVVHFGWHWLWSRGPTCSLIARAGSAPASGRHGGTSSAGREHRPGCGHFDQPGDPPGIFRFRSDNFPEQRHYSVLSGWDRDVMS